MPSLAELTTLRIGGPARRLVEAHSAEEAVTALRAAERDGEPVLVLAGGSNVVIADDGIHGTVVLMRSRGVERRDEDGRAVLTVAAGEHWDTFVASCVEQGLAGVECLSGIPGSTGATPIQNVGAYGQEVSESIASVVVYDRLRGALQRLPAADCGFSYRSSVFKRNPSRWLVLEVTFVLGASDLSAPIRYPELARELGVEAGARAPLSEVREAVLTVRRRKGMVVDAADPDSVSAGSFFTNPVLEPSEFARVERRALEQLGAAARPPRFPQADGRIKTSAAWLVERAGFTRGYGLPGPAAISTKHTLALTNRGGATAAQLLALAHEVADGVRSSFGVELVPEPVLVGLDWQLAAATETV